MIDSRRNNDVWQACLNRIKEQTSQEEFSKWFAPIIPLEFDGTNLRLKVPNESYVTHIEKNYLKFFSQIIYQIYGQQTRLFYAVPSVEEKMPVSSTADTTAISQFNTRTDTANIKNPFVIPGLKKITIDPQLNPNYTFATHIEGECNRLARSAGMTVALTPGSSPFNPLYIYGDSGLGKTHIVQAIGHDVRERHPELQVLYVSTNKFQAQFQTAYKNGEITDFIRFYQMIDVLIIDDIITTGSTLRECARVLFDAGASEVTCAVLAANQFSTDYWFSDQSLERFRSTHQLNGNSHSLKPFFTNMETGRTNNFNVTLAKLYDELNASITALENPVQEDDDRGF